MWKSETNNKRLPTRLPPIEEQQKEIQYPGWHKDTIGKGLWSGEDDEVPYGDKDIWGNMYRDDRRLMRSANFKQYLIVINDFDAV